MTSSFIYVVLAGLCEVVWSVGLEHTAGFTKLGPSLLVALSLVASMWLLALGLRTLPIGSAYAVWVGIGVLGTFVAGAVLFGEPVTGARVFFMLLLVVAIVGLKLTSAAGAS